MNTLKERPCLHRRDFLTSSLGGLTAALSCGTSLFGQDAPESPDCRRRHAGQRAFGTGVPVPDLAKGSDQTMMVQWVAPETTQDTTIYYVPQAGSCGLRPRPSPNPFRTPTSKFIAAN